MGCSSALGEKERAEEAHARRRRERDALIQRLLEERRRERERALASDDGMEHAAPGGDERPPPRTAWGEPEPKRESESSEMGEEQHVSEVMAVRPHPDVRQTDGTAAQACNAHPTGWTTLTDVSSEPPRPTSACPGRPPELRRPALPFEFGSGSQAGFQRIASNRWALEAAAREPSALWESQTHSSKNRVPVQLQHGRCTAHVKGTENIPDAQSRRSSDDPHATTTRSPKKGRTTSCSSMAEDANAVSFTPCINERSRKLASTRATSGISAADRLHAQQREKLAKREAARREREAAKLAECTFVPQLRQPHTLKKGAAAPAVGAEAERQGGEGDHGDECSDGGGQDAGDEISPPSYDVVHESPMPRVRRKSASAVPACERLHADASTRAVSRQRSVAEMAELELACHKFAPQINPTSETLLALNCNADNRPVHERLADGNRRKEEKREELRRKFEAEQPAPFKPYVNPTSAAIAHAAAMANAETIGCCSSMSIGSASSGAPPIAQRLAEEAAALAERRAMRELQREEEERKLCTFAPKVNEISSRLAEGADNGGRSVFRRLDSWAANREERRQRRELAKESEQARLYRPRVSDATDIILTARPARLHETESERIERLAYLDAQNKEAILADARETELSRHPFRPTIDSISSRLARPKTDDELVADTRGKARRAGTAAAWRAEEERELTFKPKVSALSAALAERVPGRLNPSDQATLSLRLERDRALREARLAKARDDARDAELQSCTFAPKPHRPPPARPVNTTPPVRGLNKFMERKEMARRQALEQAAREARVFNTEAIRSSSRPFTVPVPFALCERRNGELDWR